MNNYNAVFRRIKEYCQDVDILTEERIQALGNEISTNDSFLSIASYLDVLCGLGLIHYTNKHEVTLTEKGMQTTDLFS